MGLLQSRVLPPGLKGGFFLGSAKKRRKGKNEQKRGVAPETHDLLTGGPQLFSPPRKRAALSLAWQ